MLELVEHNGKWHIRNTDTGNLALNGAGFLDRDYAAQCMAILEHAPTDDDLREKEDSIRAKRG